MDNVWRGFRADLRRLLAETPEALKGYPDPDSRRSADERPCLHLAAWASDIAATLHETYGDQIDLRVGAMPFPNTEYEPHPRMTQLFGSPAEDVGLAVELGAPLLVRTGRSTTIMTWVTNNSADSVTLMTNGHLDAVVVGSDGRIVGRCTGAQILPLVTFTVEPGGRTEVPALVGTDSLVPALGYAVPPGAWSIVVQLPTAGHPVSAPMPCTITA